MNYPGCDLILKYHQCAWRHAINFMLKYECFIFTTIAIDLLNKHIMVAIHEALVVASIRPENFLDFCFSPDFLFVSLYFLFIYFFKSLLFFFQK